MNTREIAPALSTLYSELVDGIPESNGYILNRGDVGLLRSVDKLSASDASATNARGASIAAHVRHLSYALSLMNRWATGENPFKDADWAAAWKRMSVDLAEWVALRDALRRESKAWERTLASPREVEEVELKGLLASVAHIAYHLGAIRQINHDIRGPSS